MQSVVAQAHGAHSSVQKAPGVSNESTSREPRNWPSAGTVEQAPLGLSRRSPDSDPPAGRRSLNPEGRLRCESKAEPETLQRLAELLRPFGNVAMPPKLSGWHPGGRLCRWGLSAATVFAAHRAGITASGRRRNMMGEVIAGS
jgi:hypothetical protein